MIVLDQLRALRTHVDANRHVAEEWKATSCIRASNGAGCPICFISEIGGNLVAVEEALGELYENLPKYMGPFIVLRRKGIDGLITSLDRAIARLEEHEGVPPVVTSPQPPAVRPRASVFAAMLSMLVGWVK